MLPLDAARVTTSQRLPLPIGVLVGTSPPSSSPASQAAVRALEGIRTDDRVEVIAHRGAAAARPENTMAAIERGIEDGADWIEIDVQETADGEVVVFHDSDFMRLAHVDRKIWEVTAAELRGHRPRQLVRPCLRRRAGPHPARRAGGGQGPREAGDRAEVLRSRPGARGARRGAGGRVRHGRPGRADVAQLSRDPEGPGDAAGFAQRRAGGDGGGRPRGPRYRFSRGQCRPRHAEADPRGPRGGEGRLCLDRQRSADHVAPDLAGCRRPDHRRAGGGARGARRPGQARHAGAAPAVAGGSLRPEARTGGCSRWLGIASPRPRSWRRWPPPPLHRTPPRPRIRHPSGGAWSCPPTGRCNGSAKRRGRPSRPSRPTDAAAASRMSGGSLRIAFRRSPRHTGRHRPGKAAA